LSSDDTNRKNTSIEKTNVFYGSKNVVRTIAQFFSTAQTRIEFGDFMINKAKSQHIDYHELRMGHDVMITAPNELAVLLQSISTQ
jgi:hypothetical protein